MSAARWAGLVSKHFKRSRGAMERLPWERVVGARRASLDAWLEGVCGGEVSYCASFVPSRAAAGQAREVRLSARGGTRVTLVTLSDPRHVLRDLGFATGVLAPALVAATGLLNEACGRARADVWVAFMPCVERRELPRLRKAPVGPDHLNGGLTALAGGGRILVYRGEDACKVLVHELVHMYRLEDRLNISASDDAAVARLARVAPRGPVPVLGLNECFVDTLACYLHAAWVARTRGRPQADVESRVGDHMVVAAARLLAHHGRASPLVRRDGPLVEGTHAYAYIVCKAAVWHRGVAEFLDRFGGSRAVAPGEFAAHVADCLSSPGFRRALRTAARAAAESRSLRMTPVA